MIMTMPNRLWLLAAGISLGACTVDVEDVDTSTVSQNGMNMQGMNMQGMNMQGMNMQGMNMQGFELDSATISGASLSNLRVERGELVAERDGVTVRGTALVGARLYGDFEGPDAAVRLTYRITAIVTESAFYDPTKTGSTYLYTLEQQTPDGSWAPACGMDFDGRRAAIPVAATWNAHGDRVESSSMFTFACTTGVIAKCYRWGYRPWLTGYGTDMVAMHQTCTRLARADYCGDGRPHTREGTWINVWDRLPGPGPIQRHGLLPPLGMLFEAGWNTDGAVCISRARWLLDDLLNGEIANLCPDRLVPPGLLGATVCNTVSDVLGYDGDAMLFNESYLNLL
jgi:hypothetical protein